MNVRLRLSLAVAALLACCLPNSAQGAPRGIRVRPPAALVSAGTNTGSRLLYLNRCQGGCLLVPGFEDSRNNHSSIIDTPIQLAEWPHSDEDFAYVLRCVRELYAPFEIVVTDEDPGALPHYEAIVAGRGADLGFPQAGGVAPFTCAPIENAISFTFAAVYKNMRTLCNVVGQESAHAFGLDHEILCSDPLTYVSGCPIKSFQDEDAPCGEFVERPCDCGGPTQNSYRHLLAFLGEGIVPTVNIIEPAAGESLPLGFAVRAQGNDDFAVTHSQLWIDDKMIEAREQNSPGSDSFQYQVPRSLAPGMHVVEVRIFDDREQYGSASVTITQNACSSSRECDFSYSCVGGQCLLGPGNATGLGSDCRRSEDCQSAMCATDSGEGGVCTADCALAPDSCPAGSACVSSGASRRLCIPNNSGPGGFCNSSGRLPPSVPALWLFALLLLLRRRGHCGTRG